MMGTAVLECQMNGRLPDRMGDRSAYAAPQGCYRCAGNDRWAVISCTDDAEYERLARAVGHPEWLDDDRFATVLARRRHHDELDAAITEWTPTHAPYHALHTLQKAALQHPRVPA